MYGAKEVFTEAIDFDEEQEAKKWWRVFCQILCDEEEDQLEKFMDYIECASYLKKDRQIDNLLCMHNLYQSSDTQQEHQDFLAKRLGRNTQRKLTFPFYNMTLNRA